MGINLDTLLNATTVKNDSFTVTPAGASAPVGVKEARYYPRTGEIRLYLAEDIDFDKTPYRVTSNGLTDVSGNAMSLDKAVYPLREIAGTGNDIEMTFLAYVSEDGIPVYSFTSGGAYTVKTKIVNSAQTKKEATLSYYIKNANNKIIERINVSVELQPGESVFETKSINLLPGQSIDVKLWKK